MMMAMDRRARTADFRSLMASLGRTLDGLDHPDKEVVALRYAALLLETAAYELARHEGGAAVNRLFLTAAELDRTADTLERAA